MKKLSVIFAAVALLFSSATYAQTTDNKWAVFVGAHATDFTAKYGLFDGYFDTDDWTIVPPLSKLSVARSLNRFFIADLTASVGELDTNDAGTVSNLDITDEFFLNAGLGLRLKLIANGMIAKEDFFFDPYVRVGGAYQKFNYNATHPVIIPGGGSGEIGGEDNFAAQFGAGLNLWLTKGFSINIASDYNWIPDSEGSAALDFFQHTVGLGFRFGQPKDTDKDGIIDKEDECPEIAGPAENNGCPWPDTDGDGVLDKDDECVDVPGLVELNGCPEPEDGDADADGIPDSQDDCPEVAGVVSDLEGCNGCPDSDGDGICDAKDECPTDAANECKINVTFIQDTVENVFFEFNSAELTAASKAQLDNAAKVLNEGPTKNTKWLLEGHSDSKGADSYNKTLSQKRANAVKNYLESKGVDGSRLKAEGFGESLPIRSNSTEAGRAKNRRVEFKITDDNFQVKALKLNDDAAAEQINKYARQITFNVGSADLAASSQRSLDIIAEYIKISGKNWEVGGHTDNTGDDAINQKLSEKRAQSVVSYLVGKGVDTSKLTAKGYGESKPIADNKTADGKAENRRIEFSVK